MRTTTAMSRGDPPGLRRRTELVRNRLLLPVFVDQHLHSLSGSALAGLGTFRLTDPAQVLILVR